MSKSSDAWFDRKSHKGEIEGTLGLQVSPGVFTFDAGNGYQWFTSEQGTVMSVLNAKTAPTNIDVIVKMNRSGQYEVIGINTSKVVSALGANAGSVAIPPINGSTRGPTPMPIETRQLVDGLVWQDANNPIFVLTVNPFWYTDAAGDQQWWPGGTKDVTSYVPSGASTHAWVKVGLNKTGPALIAAAGSAVSVTVPLTEADLALIAFNGYVPLSGVMLTHGQTAYPVEQDFLDCSNIKDSSSSGSILSVTDGSTTVASVTEINFTSGATVSSGGAGIADVAVTGGGASTGYILIQDQKTQNTQGGTFTAGAWRTRVLNTIVTDTTGAVTLGSNQITLPAGTYRINASAPAYFVETHQIRLQNITDSTTVALGTSEWSWGASNSISTQTRSFLSGRFTIAGTKVFEIQHQSLNTESTDGFGIAANFTTEVYTTVELIKE